MVQTDMKSLIVSKINEFMGDYQGNRLDQEVVRTSSEDQKGNSTKIINRLAFFDGTFAS